MSTLGTKSHRDARPISPFIHVLPILYNISFLYSIQKFIPPSPPEQHPHRRRWNIIDFYSRVHLPQSGQHLLSNEMVERE